MENISEKIDTFETEELVHNAKMSFGDMKNMGEYIETLGGQLVATDVALKCLMAAMQDSVSAPQMQQIINLADKCRSEYVGRFTTEEMRKNLAAAGFPLLNAVLVDADFGNEAIENGTDVYALKDGKSILLERHNEVTKYDKNGYLIALTPFGYESAFLNNLKMTAAGELSNKEYTKQTFEEHVASYNETVNVDGEESDEEVRFKVGLFDRYSNALKMLD